MRSIQLIRAACGVSIISLCLSTSINSAAADTIRVCFGEDQANGCPVNKDAMFGCGVSIDQAAEQVCAITRKGVKEVAPYNYIHQGSHEGGRCGYEWYSLTCRF